MKAFKMIMLKEFARVFKDKKMIFTMFILPVIMVVFVIAVIALIASLMMGRDKGHTPVVYISNCCIFAQILLLYLIL